MEHELNGYGNVFRLGPLLCVAVFLIFGCVLAGDPADRAPALPENWLSQMIRSVPSDVDLDYLMFTNHQAAREVAGATDFKGIDFVDWSWLENVPWTYDALPANPMFSGFSQEAVQTIGVNTLLFDHGIWSAYYGTPKSHFSITTRGLNDPGGLSKRLSEAGYRPGIHSGVEFAYFLHEDEKPVSSGVVMDHPLRGILRDTNAVGTVGNRLMVASEVATMQRLIDVELGASSSLWSEEPWRVLAQTVGDELLGGVLIHPEFVGSGSSIEASMERTPAELREDWERYTEGPDEWGTLMPYTASILGYGVHEGVERTIVAVYHPDPGGAEHNAAELKRRWNSAHLDVRKHSIGGEDIPFSELCGPLETRTEVHTNASILIASCTIIERSPIAAVGTGGRDFWQGPISHHELHFLMPDVGFLTGR